MVKSPNRSDVIKGGSGIRKLRYAVQERGNSVMSRSEWSAAASRWAARYYGGPWYEPPLAAPVSASTSNGYHAPSGLPGSYASPRTTVPVNDTFRMPSQEIRRDRHIVPAEPSASNHRPLLRRKRLFI